MQVTATEIYFIGCILGLALDFIIPLPTIIPGVWIREAEIGKQKSTVNAVNNCKSKYQILGQQDEVF